jgi:hypothetical protein
LKYACFTLTLLFASASFGQVIYNRQSGFEFGVAALTPGQCAVALDTEHIHMAACVGGVSATPPLVLTGSVLSLDFAHDFTGADKWTGHHHFTPAVDSASAILVQESTGTNDVFRVDTTNERVHVGYTFGDYELNLRGDDSTSGGVFLGIRNDALTPNSLAGIFIEVSGSSPRSVLFNDFLGTTFLGAQALGLATMGSFPLMLATNSAVRFSIAAGGDSDFYDNNILNVGDIALDSLSADAGSAFSFLDHADLADNIKLRLGTGTDAEIYYDGTDLRINPSAIGGGVVRIDGGGDQLSLYHDGTDAYFRTNDGAFIFQTDEGLNNNSALTVKGKGTGFGIFTVNDEDDAEFGVFSAAAGIAFLSVAGASPTEFRIQDAADVDIGFFSSASSGETPAFKVSGFRAADALRTLSISVGASAANQVDFSGLLNYHFAGDMLLEDATPLLTLTDTTGGEDDWSIGVDGNNLNIQNLDGTAGALLRVLDSSGNAWTTLESEDGQMKLAQQSFTLSGAETRDLLEVSGSGLTITKNASFAGVRAFAFRPTIHIDTDPLLFVGDFLFESQPTYTVDDGTNNSTGYITLFSRPVVTVSGADQGTSTWNPINAVQARWLLDNDGTGTTALTVSNIVDFWSNAAVAGSGIAAANVTLSNYIGYRFDDARVTAGTLTTQYAGYIGDVASGTTDYGFWFEGADDGVIVIDDDADGQVFFGEGQDAIVWYDGTDLRIDPDNVGSGGVDIGGELEVDDLNTGGNPGSTLCYDANQRMCICGSCA